MLRNIAGRSPRTTPPAELDQDLVRIVERLGLAGGRRRQEYLSNPELFRALRRVELIENCLDLVVADSDSTFDLGPLEPLPGDLALYLALHRLDVGAVRLEHCCKLRRGLLGIFRDALNGLVDIRLLDLDLLGFCRLYLESLVDQVPEHLIAQPIDFLGRDLSTVGNCKEGEALLNVCLSDHVAVDDRGCLDDGRHGRAEQLRVLRKPQRLRAVDLWLPACLQLARLSGLLGNGAAPDAKRNCYADKRCAR